MNTFAKVEMRVVVKEKFIDSDPFSVGDVLTVKSLNDEMGFMFESKEHPHFSIHIGEVDLLAVQAIIPRQPISQSSLSRFCFHKPDETGKANMRNIRIKVRQLAHLIDELCPESREKATALTNLATVMMNANSAIVQQYPIDESDLTIEEKELLK